MQESFKLGFIQEAIKTGCTKGEAIDLFKYAIANGFTPPPPAPMQAPTAPQPPINPLVNTQQPTKNFAGPSSSMPSFNNMFGTSPSNVTSAPPQSLMSNSGQQLGSSNSTIKI